MLFESLKLAKTKYAGPNFYYIAILWAYKDTLTIFICQNRVKAYLEMDFKLLITPL